MKELLLYFSTRPMDYAIFMVFSCVSMVCIRSMFNKLIYVLAILVRGWPVIIEEEVIEDEQDTVL
jgi:hypothetical protein